MHGVFQKKGKKRPKYLKILAKMYKIWKYFERKQVAACVYCTQSTARKGPDLPYSVHLCIITKVIRSSTVKMFPSQQNVLIYQKNQEIV